MIKDFWERQAEVKPAPFINCPQKQVTGLPVFHGSYEELKQLSRLVLRETSSSSTKFLLPSFSLLSTFSLVVNLNSLCIHLGLYSKNWFVPKMPNVSYMSANVNKRYDTKL